MGERPSPPPTPTRIGGFKRRHGLTLGLALLATGFLLGCQDSGSNLAAPDGPAPQFSHKAGHNPGGGGGDGGGGGASARQVVLSGGYTAAPQGPVELKETGTEVQIRTLFEEKDPANEVIAYAFTVDAVTDGATPANAIPLSGEMDFDECRWGGQITTQAQAKQFWDDFLTAAEFGGAFENAPTFFGRRFNVTISKEELDGEDGRQLDNLGWRGLHGRQGEVVRQDRLRC